MNPSSDDTMHTLPIRPKASRLLFSLLCSLLFTLPAHAQEADTARVKELQGVEVVGRHVTGKLRHDSLGGMSLDLSFLDDMPRIAGNADPIRYTQLLPSVQTNSELDAGLYVQGSSPSSIPPPIPACSSPVRPSPPRLPTVSAVSSICSGRTRWQEG